MTQRESATTAFDYSAATDEQLWLCVQSDDDRAVEEIHARYTQKLLAIVGRNCRPPIQVEDVLQEFWIKALTSKLQFDPLRANSKLSYWFSQIISSVTNDALRKIMRIHETALPTEWDPPTGTPTSAHNLDLQIRLERCRSSVKVKLLKSLELFLDGESIEEIAGKLKLQRPETVYKYVSEAKQQLRKCLQESK